MQRNAWNRLGAICRVLGIGAVAIWLALLMTGPAWASTSSEEPPIAIVRAIDEALDSWSQFSATGETDVVRSSFVVGGPQWRQFVSEAAESAGVDARTFAVHKTCLRRLDVRTATVWTEVEVSQPGRIAETFGWDFDLTLQDGRWLVWTVVTADEPTGSEIEARALPSAATPSTSQPPAASVLTQRRIEAESEPTKAAGTRIPALSAWVVVVTVIGVAAAGYVAPRLDRRRP